MGKFKADTAKNEIINYDYFLNSKNDYFEFIPVCVKSFEDKNIRSSRPIQHLIDIILFGLIFNIGCSRVERS